MRRKLRRFRLRAARQQENGSQRRYEAALPWCVGDRRSDGLQVGLGTPGSYIGQDGSFKAGEDGVFDVKSGAVGLGKVSPAGQPFEADVKEISDQIAAGEITDIPTEVGK